MNWKRTKHKGETEMIVIGRIISVIVADALILFLGMQIANLIANAESILNGGVSFTLDYNILFWQGNNDYFHLVLLAIIGVDLLILLNPFFSKSYRERRKAMRKLSSKELEQYSQLSTVHQAKKGLLRLELSKDGHIANKEFDVVSVLIGKVCAIFWGCSTVYYVLLLVAVIRERLFKSALGSFLGTVEKITVPFSLALLGSGILFLVLGRGYIRDYCDQVFDSAKKSWNQLLDTWSRNTPWKCSDMKKMNTRKRYNYNPQLPYVHGGLPILTKRKMLWVDPTASHSLIIGTTNSGKTFSVIHILIDIARMAGESMVINDLKGELYKMHYDSLIADGYDVKVLNFVDPDASDYWNPFGLVYKAYRNAQDEFERTYGSNEHYIAMMEAKKSLYRCLAEKEALYNLFAKQAAESNMERGSRRVPSKKILSNIDGRIAKARRIYREEKGLLGASPDFSDAFEYLKEIATAIGDEPNAKDRYWSDSAIHLIEGAVCFLLEQEELQPDGSLKRLEENQINFRNIKILVDQGLLPHKICGGTGMLLDYYLQNFRFPDDQSVIKLMEIVQTPDQTRTTIVSVFGNKMDLGTLNDRVARMTSKTNFSFEDIGRKKTAVFMIVHDEKETYYPLVTLFVQQMYVELIKTARGSKGDKLPVPVHLIWDEFGLSPKLENIIQILAAARSRGVKMYMVVQDLAQLDAKYGKDLAKSIKNNVMNIVFLLSGEKESRSEISELAGEKLAWDKDTGKYNAVPVITKERLSTLSLGDAVIIRQRKYPLITRYYPYNRYVFYKSLSQEGSFIRKPLPEIKTFRLTDAYDDIVRMVSGGEEMQAIKEQMKEPEQPKPRPFPGPAEKHEVKDSTPFFWSGGESE